MLCLWANQDENEDKHSSCFSFFENGPCVAHELRNANYKMLINLCKEHLVILTFRQITILVFFFLHLSFICYIQESIKKKKKGNW